MIDQRILKLLKTPEEIKAEDLPILEQEIGKYPFIQSIRALYLYGTHRHDLAAYKNLLTATAAYTTDKKILYQFINRETKSENNNVVEEKEIPATNDIVPLSNAVSGNLKSKFESTKSTFPKVKIEEEVVENQLGKEEEEITEHIEEISEQNIESAQEILTDQQLIEEVNVGDFSTREDIEQSFDEENESIPEVVEIVDISMEKSSDEVAIHDLIEVETKDVLEVEETILDEEPLVEKDPIEENKNSNEETIEVDGQFEEKIEEKVPYEISIAEPIISKENSEISEIKKETTQEDNSQLSFYERFDHLPKVEIKSVKEEYISEAPKQNPERHLSEMDRLIAEVEAKMKQKKVNQTEEIKVVEEEVVNADISFAENYDSLNEIKTLPVEPSTTVEDKKEEEVVKEEVSHDVQPEILIHEDKNREWKPLMVENNLPDALITIQKSEPEFIAKIQQPIIEEPKILEEVLEINKAVEQVQETEERPVLNVSFFSNDVKPFEPVQKVDKIVEPIDNKENKLETVVSDTSNVPHFINTWQNWLKVDKKDSVLLEENNDTETVDEPENVEVEKEEIKAKAIETFIENNPKISKLKEETDFVVKEKGENISHLMTETLAGLYVQQKLYTKAIGAYQILKEKYPDKEEYFEEKIKEVKEIRSAK